MARTRAQRTAVQRRREQDVLHAISLDVWCLVAQPLQPQDKYSMKATCRTFRVAVDRSWRRVTVDLTELARQHARLPCLSTFPHLREVAVTCNTRMQPSYWSIDYISNERAPGLTSAALSGALARVHLGGLPERGADARVLTLRGVGFEVSARWLERLLATKRCGGAGRFGSVRLATDCLPDGGLAAQLAHARVHLDALAPERCLPALLSGAYGRLAALEVTGVEHWPGRGGSTALLAALRPAALPALAALTLRGAPEFALLPAGALAGLALPGLTALALDGVACAGPGAPGAFAFGALAHLTRLAELRLTRQLTVAVNPAGAAPPGCLAALAGLGRLSALRLDRAGGLAGAAALGGSLTRLRLLLRGPPADPGATLAGLAALPRLRELDVDLRMHARAGRAGGPGRRGAGPPEHLAPVAALRQLRTLTLREAVSLDGCAHAGAVFAWLGAPLAAALPRLDALLLLGAHAAGGACAPMPARAARMAAGGRLWRAGCARDHLLDCLHLSFTAGPAAAALAERALGAELAALAGWAHPASDAEPDSEPDSDESDLD